MSVWLGSRGEVVEMLCIAGHLDSGMFPEPFHGPGAGEIRIQIGLKPRAIPTAAG